MLVVDLIGYFSLFVIENKKALAVDL